MIPIPTAMAAEASGSAVKIIVFALALIGAALAGASLMADHKNAEIADLKADHALQEAADARRAKKRLQDAQHRGDILTARLAKAEAELDRESKDHAREIKRLTTGRACLNAGTVQLLNNTGPGIRLPGVPAPAGQPATADAAPRSDSDVGEDEATDTDVAGWIDYAKRRYETCRGRLQALIDWEEAPTP